MDTSEELKGKSVRILLRDPLEVGEELVTDISGTWGGIQGGFFSVSAITQAMNKARQDVTNVIPANSLVLGNANSIAFLLAQNLPPR